MPGAAGAGGTNTRVEGVPPVETCITKAPAILALAGTAATNVVAVPVRPLSGLPSTRNCASGPNPDPTAMMVSPGATAPARLLATLTTESRRGAGDGGRDILLAATVLATLKDWPGSRPIQKLPAFSIDPASTIFPSPSTPTPRASKGRSSPR